jgi:hypothetical protein
MQAEAAAQQERGGNGSGNGNECFFHGTRVASLDG